MTDGNDPRFLVWKGAEPDSWMVWDRQIRASAKTFYGSFYGLATGLTEEEARQVRDWLTLKHQV
jgi:hypothetical protein